MKYFICCLFSLIYHQSQALKPAKNYLVTPDTFGLNYETLNIPTIDSSLNLKAWKILPAPADDRKTVIIIAYGDAGNMSYYLQQAYALVSNGFTVITFDYRGFGESSYFALNEKFLYYNVFATDLCSVIRWSRMHLKDYKTGVLGFSMGTAMAAMANQSDPLDFIVAEGLLYHPFIVSIRIGALKHTEVLIPDGAERLMEFYSAITCQLLVFAGTQDLVTTIADSKTVVKQKKNRKLVSFKANHLQGFEALSKKKYGDKYVEQIIRFIGS